MVICLERYADLHMAQLMPLPLTVSCFSKIQIGFTFLVPAHLGSPGKRAVKWVCMRVFLPLVFIQLSLSYVAERHSVWCYEFDRYQQVLVNVNSVSILQWLQVKPPKDLMGRLRELFCEQEQQRQELLLQHFKERVSCLNCYWPRHLVA